MTQETSLFISAIGTDGANHYVVINNEKISINRKQYFRLMSLSEDYDNLSLNDAADYRWQMLSGIPAF